jgi:hypothetical protein
MEKDMCLDPVTLDIPGIVLQVNDGDWQEVGQTTVEAYSNGCLGLVQMTLETPNGKAAISLSPDAAVLLSKILRANAKYIGLKVALDEQSKLSPAELRRRLHAAAQHIAAEASALEQPRNNRVDSGRGNGH